MVQPRDHRPARLLVTVFLLIASSIPAAAAPRPYRLPGTERLPQVLWGAECIVADDLGLSFGGEDQKADDGAARTRIRVAGQWRSITEELRNANPLQKDHDQFWVLRTGVKDALARLRFGYFQGAPQLDQIKAAEAEALPLLRSTLQSMGAVAKELSNRKPDDATTYQRAQIGFAVDHLRAAHALMEPAIERMVRGIAADDLVSLHRAQIQIEIAAETLDAEPAPRALSMLVYEPAAKLFILFGGDHLDYLTNDTWAFDPAKKQWSQRHPKLAPPPRANHRLEITDGRCKLTGGYTYFNDIWYTGGPYIDIGDGDWLYDTATDQWKSTGPAEGVVADRRTYRQKEFHPEFYLQGERPDAPGFAARLRDLPANTWVPTKPPHLPKMNRDWGTAVIDPDHDVILRWSGGHSAHGGSDVLMFHLASNRWELPFPVEFPLGQTYSNTSYPEGVNFNRRPWVTGHTYKSYDYDPASKTMVFVGRSNLYHVFDSAIADWSACAPKPAGMSYGSGYYDLQCKRIGDSVICWTRRGQLFRFAGKTGQWEEIKVAGAKLPGSAVDSAGIDYDSRRNRLLLFPCGYGKPYSGQIVMVDLKTMEATEANPGGMAGAVNMPALLRETCYVASADLVLVGVTLPPAEDGVRWSAAYDCATNKWVSIGIDGPSPAGKSGRNVSLGLMYDARRDLIWAVDTSSNVHVLRLHIKSARKKDL